MRAYCLFLIVLLGLAGVNADATETIRVDGVAAMVNERVITFGELRSALEPMERQLRQQFSGAELMNRLDQAYERVLQNAIERSLILEEFSAMGGEIPRQIIDEQVQAVLVEEFDGDRGMLLRALAQEGLSMEEWRRQLGDQLKIMSLRSEKVLPNVVVSPRQIREAYETRRDEFFTEPGTRIRIITLAIDEETDQGALREQAMQIKDAIAAPDDFALLAQQYSTDRFAANGGDRGWIDPQRMLRADLAQAAEALDSGEVSEWIETDTAWYLVFVEGRREGGLQRFEDVRDDLALSVRRAEEERIFEAWINRLRNRHHVQVFHLDAAQ